jgi:hypothetical protein
VSNNDWKMTYAFLNKVRLQLLHPYFAARKPCTYGDKRNTVRHKLNAGEARITATSVNKHAKIGMGEMLDRSVKRTECAAQKAMNK